MQVLAVEFDLRLPGCQSLKEKRAVVRPIVDGLRNRHAVSVAETDHQDLWQRAAIGVAVVSETPGHAREMMDEVERFVWSFPEIEVLSAMSRWLEED